MFGLAIMTGAFAGAVTQPLVVALLAVTTWRHTFALFGMVGLVWAVAWWRWFRDDPAEHPGTNQAERALLRAGGAEPRERRPLPWRRMLASRTLLALCTMYAGAIYGWYFYLTWLPTYLLRARGFDLAHAGALAALPLLGIGVGVLAGGWASDALVRRLGARAGRRIPGLVGFPLAAAAIAGAIVTDVPLHAALFLAAAAGLAALGVAPAWAVCLEIGGVNSGVVSGAMNTFGNLGGAASPIVVGLSLERWHSWEAPLWSVAACYLVAALAWLAIDPRRLIE
jgi:nitrate/nitrite transporter NarK